jgi:chromosome segregation ATPase
MRESLRIAIARFPDRGHAIEELARVNDDFQSLCDELADVDAAFERWKQSPSPVREARCAEYQELVDDLAAEVETILNCLSRRVP